jgi:hypothetical protein
MNYLFSIFGYGQAPPPPPPPLPPQRNPKKESVDSEIQAIKLSMRAAYSKKMLSNPKSPSSSNAPVQFDGADTTMSNTPTQTVNYPARNIPEGTSLASISYWSLPVTQKILHSTVLRKIVAPPRQTVFPSRSAVLNELLCKVSSIQ